MHSTYICLLYIHTMEHYTVMCIHGNAMDLPGISRRVAKEQDDYTISSPRHSTVSDRSMSVFSPPSDFLTTTA